MPNKRSAATWVFVAASLSTRYTNANKVRDWRMYADFAQSLIKIARPLYSKEDLGLDLDNTVILTGVNSKNDYPQSLRRIKYHDGKIDLTFNFITNNFLIPAQTAADLYRYRWQVELFFKWIKQHLRIKSFFGTSEELPKML